MSGNGLARSTRGGRSRVDVIQPQPRRYEQPPTWLPDPAPAAPAAGAAMSRLVPGRPLDANEPVRHRFITTEVLRKGDEVVRMIEVDRVPPRGDEVDRFAVERAPLRHVGDLARLVQQRVHLLVASQRLIEAAAAGLGLVDVRS